MDKILIKTDKLEVINENEILQKLYYNLASLPTSSEIEIYNKKYSTEFDLEKLKLKISNIVSDLPLFDIVSQNIYLIPASHVFTFIKELHYRIATQKIYDFLVIALSNAKTKKLKHKLEKNVRFIESYNFDQLFITYLKVIYSNSNQIGKDITDCKRISFLPYLTNIESSPYYSRSEMINLALNLNLIKPDMTIYQDQELNKLCLNLIKNDISNEMLITHQFYIKKNNAQHIIYYYTFYGSQFYNKYLRNTSNIYDEYMVNNINLLHSLIKKAPAFDTDVYVYRFISSDDYLQHVQVNGFFKEESFISSTRNPFYKPDEHMFGYILLKIKLPKNKQGIGLCVETYSLFPNEQEIILSPGTLKLISISDNDSENNSFIYYHTDINAQKLIHKKYEFEYIEPHDTLNKLEKTNNTTDIYTMPDNFTLISSDPEEKIIEFYRSIPIINEMHYFKLDKYIFQVFYFNKAMSYKKYYFLLNNKPENQEILFLVLQDPKTQEINLIIEISDIISVNYLHRFTCAKTLKDEELINIIEKISKLFNIQNSIIHPIFNKYIVDSHDEKNITSIINQNEYFDEEVILNFSADLISYNHDVFNYMNKANERFQNISTIINKMDFSSLDRLKRLSPDLILKISDPDELYRIYIKNKFTNIVNMLLYLQEHIFYLVPLLIKKITLAIKKNPFLYGYYVYSHTYINDLDFDNQEVKLEPENKRSL
jgi:hypothetical protein